MTIQRALKDILNNFQIINLCGWVKKEAHISEVTMEELKAAMLDEGSETLQSIRGISTTSAYKIINAVLKHSSS